MKVAIGGSRKLPPGSAVKVLGVFVARLVREDDVEILLRKGINTEPGEFEQDIAELAELVGLKVSWREPQITDKHRGRASVFIRDMDMAAEADLVVAVVEPGFDEYSGTAHFMEKAIEADRPVYGYVWDASVPILLRIGENDPDDRWSHLVVASRAPAGPKPLDR